MSAHADQGFFSLAVVATALAVLLSLQLPEARVLKRQGVAGSTGGKGACALAVAPLGYDCEEHEVKTEEGYILGVQRIPKGRRAPGGLSPGRQPVLLQHGVIVDGMVWLLSPPEQALPYILADHGFDVWIANTRGTRWSRRHVSLLPSNKTYWNWSWDELVMYDMPAVVDYVCNRTGQKLHFVGQSMGALLAAAALSEGRLVNKMKSAVLLAPTLYLSHITTPIGKLLAKSMAGELISGLGAAEFNPGSPAVTNLLASLCRKPGTNCYDLIRSFTGSNFCLNNSNVDVFLKYEPQSTSTKTAVHLAQTVRDGALTKYNFGRPELNKAKYGQPKPPAYNMSNIPTSFPLFVSYGDKDSLADPTDVRLFLDDLKSHDRDKLTVQYLDLFAHADFVIGVCAKDYVFNEVVLFFNRFN